MRYDTRCFLMFIGYFMYICCVYSLEYFDIPLIPVLTHILVLALGLIPNIAPNKFPKFLNLELIEPILPILFLKEQEHSFLLHLFLPKLIINGLEFHLPDFLGLVALLLQLGDLLLEGQDHLGRDGLQGTGDVGFLLQEGQGGLERFYQLLLLYELLVVFAQDSLGGGYLLVQQAGLLLYAHQLAFEVL